LIVWLGKTVVEQVYSGAVTCSRDDTRRQYPEMLQKKYQNAYCGRAPYTGIVPQLT